MQSYILILVFFMVGFLLNRYSALSEKQQSMFTDVVNRWIIAIALPAIIIRHVPSLTFSQDVFLPMIAAWLWLALGILCVFFVSRLFSFRRDVTGAMLLLVTLGNTSFIGYPMVSAFFTDEVLSYAIFYDQLGSFIALSTFGTLVLAIYSSPSSGKQSGVSLFTTIVIKIIKFPPLIALALSLLIPAGPLLMAIDPLLAVIGASLMPLALIVLGLQFQPILLPEQKVPLIISIGLKMFIAPFLVWLLIRSVNAPNEAIQASIFESAMPPMMTPGILAMQAGLAPRFCATLLGYSALLSLFTLPVIAVLLSITR